MMIPYDRIGQLAQQINLAPVTIPDDGRFNETDIQQVTVDDHIYGMPYLLETLVLYYNKDLLDTEPTTFEDLETLNYLTEWYAKWLGMLDEGTVGYFIDQSFIDGNTVAVINGPWGASRQL